MELKPRLAGEELAELGVRKRAEADAELALHIPDFAAQDGINARGGN